MFHKNSKLIEVKEKDLNLKYRPKQCEILNNTSKVLDNVPSYVQKNIISEI